MLTPGVRLIASDLDGTLVRDDGSVSERTRHVLGRAQSAGLLVTLVTARHASFVKATAQAAGALGPAICSNGASVYDPVDDTLRVRAALEPAVARRLVSRLRQAIPDIGFAIELGPRMLFEHPFAASIPSPLSQLLECDDVLDLCVEPVTKIVLRHLARGSVELLPTAVESVGDAGAVTYSSPNTIEISHPLVNKSWGLAQLCRDLGIDPAEVVAFGDMPNDLQMLRWAGRGVAVANADPIVLAAADEVTASNMDDGVAVVVERLLRDAQPSRASNSAVRLR